MKTHSNTAAVSALVRTHDYDRYLTARFAPAVFRDALMAVFAFSCELERIPALVSEPALGEIRLQWWRDILEDAFEQGMTGNPVADSLKDAIRVHQLSKPQIQGMIDARSADLDGGGFPDLEALRAYLYKTHGAVFALSAGVVDDSNARIGQTANQAGVAYGLTRVLLRLPFDAAGGRVMLPLSLLQAHGVAPEQILAGEEGEEIPAIVAALAQEARAALDESRAGLSSLPRHVQHVFAPLALVEPSLRALEKTGIRVLKDVTEVNPLARFFRVWRASRTGNA